MYYEDNFDLSHQIQELKVNLLGLSMHFETDSGVFSKNAVDYGSKVLLANFSPIGKTLLDVGCGYGTLALTLSKKYNLEATLTDVNSRALDLAKKNADMNAVVAKIIKSDAYEEVSEKFDNIISNPPIRAGKEVVHRILEGAHAHLNTGGQLVVVIQKKQGAPSALEKMKKVFGNSETVAKDKGYYILRSLKV